MVSPGRIVYLARRAWERGWPGAWHAAHTLARIRQWREPAGLPEAAVPVHLLTGPDDWLLAGWMLASFTHFTGRSWPLVVHDDGRLPPEGRELYTSLFRRVRIVSRPEADAAMAGVLAASPHCARYRTEHPLALKIFDVPALTGGERFLLLDSDVLFYRRPEEILAWLDGKTDGCWFNEDVAEGALVSAEEARATTGTTLWPRVNTGLCLLERAAIELSFCEQVLRETRIRQGHIWRVEQTLLALCATRYGLGGLLPRTYEVSLGPGAAPDAVARHYVGAVRDRFYGEGLERLHRTLLPRA